MAQAINFYKGTMPSTLSVGCVYFDTATKTIKVATSTSAFEEFGGKITDATLANNKLSITKSDGSTVVVDMSDVASASTINTILSAMKINNKALFSSTEGQSVTLSGADVKLTGLTAASSYSVPAATDTINQAIAKLTKGKDANATAAANAQTTANSALTAASNADTAASKAQSTADTAKSTAEQALSDAADAISAANIAQEEVNNLNDDITKIKVNGHTLILDVIDDPDSGTVLNGSDIKLTGLSTVSSYSVPAATDTINQAVAKLTKGVSVAASSMYWSTFS